jgi:TolB-like protein
MRAHAALVREPFAEQVRHELEQIFQIPSFKSSERLRRLLTFLIDKALNEPTPNLKEYVIAVEVFDKPESFDPRIDPIVRVQASRLRSKLKNYFETTGMQDPISILLPERGYCPIIQVRRNLEPSRVVRVIQREPKLIDTLFILPFIPLGTELELRFFSQGLTDELIGLMTNGSGLRIVACSGPRVTRERVAGAVILEGRIRRSETHFRISAQLINMRDSAYIWSAVYTRDASDPLKVQEEVSRAIVSAISFELGRGVSKVDSL